MLDSPEVHVRVNFQTSPETHFYIIGSPRFGILNFIVENIQENGFTAEIVMDKRDIPDIPRDSTTRVYVVTHEYDRVSGSGTRGPRDSMSRPQNVSNNLDNEFIDATWRLNIRVFEYNPFGTDRQVAIATTTAYSYTAKELVDAVLNELFAQAHP
jgi:hypothetical protein